MEQLRGLMLDSARCLENRAYYRRAIEFAAMRGVNVVLWHFTDDQGCTLEFESVPGIASAHAYSKAEMRELIALARGLGITIVPEVASLGHSRYITRLPEYQQFDEVEDVFTGICPVASQTRAVLTKLIDETCEVFDSPWIHVGLDEANIGHHPLTRQALQTRSRGEIFADHINFMHEQVQRHGRTMMMWGDGLLADDGARKRISREIVICDWQYGARVDGQTTQQLLDDGFSVVLCPALISHDQTLFPGDQLAVSNVRTTMQQLNRRGSGTGGGRVLGAITTIWQPERYMHDALWMAIDLATAFLREGADVSVEQVTSRFADEFYGLSPSDAWVQAVRQVYRLSPLRPQWLALLKMENLHLAGPAIAEKARRWREILDVVAAAEDSVKANRRAYHTFVLMIELVAHLYRKAVLLSGKKPAATAEAKQIIERERTLLAELDSVWDQERFADDPKKFTAARSCFRENNLLAMFREMSLRSEALVVSAASDGRADGQGLELSLHLPRPAKSALSTS